MDSENVACVRMFLESGADANIQTEYDFKSAYKYAEDYMKDTDEGNAIKIFL